MSTIASRMNHRTALVIGGDPEYDGDRVTRLRESVGGTGIKVDDFGHSPVDVATLAQEAADAGYEMLIVAIPVAANGEVSSGENDADESQDEGSVY